MNGVPSLLSTLRPAFVDSRCMAGGQTMQKGQVLSYLSKSSSASIAVVGIHERHCLKGYNHSNAFERNGRRQTNPRWSELGIPYLNTQEERWIDHDKKSLLNHAGMLPLICCHRFVFIHAACAGIPCFALLCAENGPCRLMAKTLHSAHASYPQKSLVSCIVQRCIVQQQRYRPMIHMMHASESYL